MAHDYPINVGSPATGEPSGCRAPATNAESLSPTTSDVAPTSSPRKRFIKSKNLPPHAGDKWPGAKVTLRPDRDGLSTGADAPPPNQNRHQE